jgi:hypothetical protein
VWRSEDDDGERLCETKLSCFSGFGSYKNAPTRPSNLKRHSQRFRLKILDVVDEKDTSKVSMADTEVGGDLRSNLFDQRRFISSVNECSGYINLKSKLKCAQDEVSSLNLIIQLLRNELKSDWCIDEFGH